MANIMVVGAGVVGTVTGIGLTEHGHTVTFADTSDSVLGSLRLAEYRAICPEDINLSGVEVVFVAVTALTGENGIDLTHVVQATRILGEKLAAVEIGFPVIVYRCTMPPGTVRDVLTPFLEQVSRKQAGEDFGVVYNPEYLRAVSALEDFRHPRVVTLASFEEHDRAHKVMHGIMSDFGATIYWLPLEAAELQKYVSNVFNAFKISSFNWFREIAERLGLDPAGVFEVCVNSAQAMWDPSYGTHDFGPYSGACLPKDVKALLHFVRQLGIDTSLLDAVMDINSSRGGA